MADNTRKHWNSNEGDDDTRTGGQMGDETQNMGRNTTQSGGGWSTPTDMYDEADE